VKDHPASFVSYTLHDDGGPTSPDYMPREATLNLTAPGSDIPGDLQITPGAVPCSRPNDKEKK
jgi:hypothetical protein